MTLSHSHIAHLNRLALSLQLGRFRARLYGWGIAGREWWQQYGWRNQLHMHSFFEVAYVNEGHGVFHILGQDYPLQPGILFVAKPTQVHEIISSRENPLDISFWSYSLTPSQQLSSANPQGIDMLLEAFLSSPCWVSRSMDTIEPTLQLLAAEVTQRDPGYLAAIEGLLIKLLLDSARAVTPLDLPDKDLDTSEHTIHFTLVQQMLRYIHDNYSRPLHLNDLAGYVHLSKRHATRIFEKEMGTSIKKYVSDYRLKQATSLLRNQHLLIKEVALACGYPDAQHFATAFRQSTGTTPLQFRQQQIATQRAAPLPED